MAFSVLMSVYKNERPKYLKECFESLKNQTLQPDEIVLVIDGPIPEDLSKVIQEAKAQIPCLNICQLDENVQLGRALRKGVALCKNEWIARMDTDDKAVFDRFEIQYTYIQEHPHIAAIGGWIEEFRDDTSQTKTKKMPLTMSEIRPYAKYRNPLNHMTVMFKKDCVLKAGNYEHFPYLEDYHLWTRMLSNGEEFYNIPKVLVQARTSDHLYKRRGGVSYCANYLKLRRLQYQLHVTNFFEFLKGSAISIAIALQPTFLRKFVYKKIIRK